MMFVVSDILSMYYNSYHHVPLNNNAIFVFLLLLSLFYIKVLISLFFLLLSLESHPLASLRGSMKHLYSPNSIILDFFTRKSRLIQYGKCIHLYENTLDYPYAIYFLSLVYQASSNTNQGPLPILVNIHYYNYHA